MLSTKRLAAAALAALMALIAICAPALAEETPAGGESYAEERGGELTLSGTLAPVREITITAPFGGTVLACGLKTGDAVKAGDALFTLSTTKVYAPADGIIAALFVSEGDELASVLYDAPIWLEPSSPYIINATTSGAYNSTEAKYIHAGERVWLYATGSDERSGNGVVTSVSGSSYTVEVLDGSLRINEMCNISRSDDPDDTKLRIGSGKTVRSDPVAIGGEGSVLRLHVKRGDSVKRGELVMETVRGDLRVSGARDGQVLAPVDGVITGVSASVGAGAQENQAMLTMYELGTLEAVAVVDEDDLPRIAAGDAVTVELDCALGERIYKGVVRAIASVAKPNEKGVMYDAYISFDNDGFLREGMSVTVSR